MTLRRALYQSRNIPAIKLGMEVGLENVIDEARRFGVTTDVAPVPSISIGAADVVPLEIISAYTAFANDGQRAEPQAILRVEDRDGNILWQPAVAAHPGARARRSRGSSPTCCATWSVAAPPPAPSVRRSTSPAAGKTGTTNDGFDVWYRRLHARARHRHLDRLRPAEEDHEQRAGRPPRRTGVDHDDEGGLRPALHRVPVESPRGPAGRRDRQHHRLPRDAVLSHGRCAMWSRSRLAPCPPPTARCTPRCSASPA